MRKKMALIIVVLTALLAGCGRQASQVQETVSGEQLKERLLALGDNATISSDEDMEALWNYLGNNVPIRDDAGKLKWQMTDNCYLTILEGRAAIKLVDEDITYLKFVTTIDCPTYVHDFDISFIVSKESDKYEMGTYTNENATRWFLGRASKAAN